MTTIAPPEHSSAVPASVLRGDDIVRVGTHGLRNRRSRTALSALGVAIGIAALVAVLGLSDSSRADLLNQLDALGTNLLTVEAGEGFGTGDADLPDAAAARVARVATVQQVTGVSRLDVSVRRNRLIDEGETGGISVVAADANLLETQSGVVEQGAFLTPVTEAYPGAVLGSVAAQRLGIDDVGARISVIIGDVSVPVVGILEPFPLAEDLDRAVIVGYGAALDHLTDADELPPSTVYVRAEDAQVVATRDLLPETIDPENPDEVQVSRPSDALEAQAAAESAFSSLFLALGAVALLVGGIGIANVMVIAVIERRSEIGLRRALGATRRHIRLQFLTEALVLAGGGGLIGVLIGVGITAAYATLEGWPLVIPAVAVGGGLAAALLIGAIAGLYPAVRAARLSPTDALRTQ